MSTLKHITKHGERLDQIAFNYYGDVAQVPLILDANPRLKIARSYPAGVMIYIPLIQQKPSSTEGLPPWLLP